MIIVKVPSFEGDIVEPSWLGDETFHASHRSNLLRKDAGHYGQFGWTEPNDLPYIWPSGEDKMDYKTMTLEEQQTTHSEMIATAHDLGMVVPEALKLDFSTTDQGANICRSLDSAIKKYRASHPDTTKETSEEGVVKGDAEVQTEKVPTPAKEKTKPKPDKGAAKEKKTVAKKAVAKKAAKKAVAKKVATDRAPRAGALDENAKVTWIGLKGENPYRGEKKERYEKLRKASGKTVKTVIAGGVPSETLRNAVKNKMVKIG